MTLSAFKGILNNVSKEFLISPLVDSGLLRSKWFIWF